MAVKKWSEITATPEFQALDDEARDVVRQSYYERVVAPRVAEADQPAVKERFERASGLGSRRLPDGVKPSTAGGGRGLSMGATAPEVAPAPPAARTPTARSVAAESPEAPPMDPMGMPTTGAITEGGRDIFASRRSILEDPNPYSDPTRYAPGDLEALDAQNRRPEAIQAEQVRQRNLGIGVSEAKSSDSFIAPTGGIGAAALAAPGLAVRGLGESGLKAGAVMADLGISVPNLRDGSPVSARELRESAGFLARESRAETSAINDEALVKLGPLLTQIVPSARTVAEGLGEVGRQVALNIVLPGGIIADAGIRGTDEAMMRGLEPGAALLVGALKAATEGVPEQMSARFGLKQGAELRLSGILSDPKIGVEAVKRFGKSMGVELTTEQASAVGGWAVDKMAQDPTATLDRLGRDMVDAVKSTLVQAPGMMAAGKVLDMATGQSRKITPYDIAAQRGFNVEPPLTTDDPVTLLKRRVSTFQNVAAQYGIAPAAVARAVETAKTMPAEQVGPFLKNLVGALGKRGMVKAEPDPAILDTLAAAPLEPAPEPAKPNSGSDKPNSATPTDAKTQAVDAIASLLGADAAPAEAVVAAAQTAAATEGPEFVAFDDATGTLKIPRTEMPQVKAGDRSALVQYLRARGVDYAAEQEVPATDLKPTQAEYSPAKVAQAKGFTDTNRSILVSADGHVLDGHHQWLAKLADGEPVSVIRLNAPIADLLPMVRDFPSAAKAEGATDVGPAVAPGVDGVGSAGRDPEPVGGAEPAPVLPAVREGGAPAAAADGAAGPGAAPGAARSGADERSAPLTGPRKIGSAGTTPKTAEPIELRANPDGTLTPYQGKYPLTDYESGEPVVVPADSTDDQAFAAIKASGALGRRTKIFTDKPAGAESAAAPAAAPAEPGGALRSVAPDTKTPVAAASEAQPASLTPELAAASRDWDQTNRGHRNEEWQAGSLQASRTFDSVRAGGRRVQAHGMAKVGTLAEGIKNLTNILTNGFDPNRTLYYDPLTSSDPNGNGGATAGGHAYRDGPFIITFREGLDGGQPTLADVTGVLVNPAHSQIAARLQEMFPNLVIRDYYNPQDVIAASLNDAPAANDPNQPARPTGETPASQAPTAERSDAPTGAAADPATRTAAADETAGVKPGKAKRSGAAQKAGSEARNPFKAFLGRHGISIALAPQFAPGQAERRAAMVPGYGPIFRKNGLNLDELAQRATEDGFLPPGDEDQTRLFDMITSALKGERIIPEYVTGAVDAEMQARRDRELEDAEEAALELEALADDQLTDIDALWNDAAPPQSTADAMKALGFTDQEIRDATNPEGQEGATRGEGDRGAAAPAAPGGEAGDPRGDEVAGAAADEGLTSPTQADLEVADRRARDAEAADRKEQKRLADKARADAERNEFTLTGSDRPADIAAAAGQSDIFAAAPAMPSDQAQARAFANDFAALAGRELVQTIQIAGTTQTATLKVDAAQAMRQLAQRERTLRELRDCIGRSS